MNAKFINLQDILSNKDGFSPEVDDFEWVEVDSVADLISN